MVLSKKMYQLSSLLIAEVADEKWEPPSLEQVIILAAALISLVLIGIYVVNIFRGSALGTPDENVSHLDEFRRLREEGMLDESEFAQVRSTIIQDAREKVDFREDTSGDTNRNDQS